MVRGVTVAFFVITTRSVGDSMMILVIPVHGNRHGSDHGHLIVVTKVQQRLYVVDRECGFILTVGRRSFINLQFGNGGY